MDTDAASIGLICTSLVILQLCGASILYKLTIQKDNIDKVQEHVYTPIKTYDEEETKFNNIEKNSINSYQDNIEDKINFDYINIV